MHATCTLTTPHTYTICPLYILLPQESIPFEIEECMSIVTIHKKLMTVVYYATLVRSLSAVKLSVGRPKEEISTICNPNYKT